MTELQLKIQKRANKDLKFGCYVNCHFVADEPYEPSYVSENLIVYEKQDDDLVSVIGTKADEIYEIYVSREAAHENFSDTDYISEVVGKPMDYGRLCFVLTNDTELNTWLGDIEKWKVLQVYMDHNRITFDQTVLEWSVEFQQIVLDYLETVDLSLIEK